MFVAHFRDGKSVSEKDCGWKDLPNQLEITSLQLVHTPHDLMQAIHSDLEDLIPVLSEELKPSGLKAINAVKKYVDDKALLSEQEKPVFELAQIKEIFDEWAKQFRMKNEEINVLRSIKAEEEEIARAEEAKKRIDYFLMIINRIRSNSRFWLDQQKDCITLRGSSLYNYQFFQDKFGEHNIRILSGKMVRTEDKTFTHQRIGMIVDQKGHCICAGMDMLTGWIKVYYTTIHSLTLNLELYPYINLRKIRKRRRKRR